MIQSLALVALVIGSVLAGAPPSDPRPLRAIIVEAATQSNAEPPDTEELPEGVALSTTLAEFTTRFHTWGRNRARARNVAAAADKLDGSIIPPGGTLSFNEAVGPRTRRNGFFEAMVIDSGELVPGMGGGVCQTASTLHAAALEAGLEITAARPHSRPSTYIALGLDATVAYGQLDLEVRNPFDFPVLVEASAEDGEMHVALVGQDRRVEVEVDREVLGRSAFRERVVLDPTLPLGVREVAQAGIRGATVRLTRTIEDVATGVSSTESRIVRYPSNDAVIRIGAGAMAAL